MTELEETVARLTEQIKALTLAVDSLSKPQVTSHQSYKSGTCFLCGGSINKSTRRNYGYLCAQDFGLCGWIYVGQASNSNEMYSLRYSRSRFDDKMRLHTPGPNSTNVDMAILVFGNNTLGLSKSDVCFSTNHITQEEFNAHAKAVRENKETT